MFKHLPTEDDWYLGHSLKGSKAPPESLKDWLEPWLLDALDQGLDEPYIYPTYKGGIYFEWDEAVDPSSVCVSALFTSDNKSAKVEFTDLCAESDASADCRDYVFDLSDKKQSDNFICIINMTNKHQEPPSVLYDKIEEILDKESV